jgi:hypothetical protein
VQDALIVPRAIYPNPSKLARLCLILKTKTDTQNSCFLLKIYDMEDDKVVGLWKQNTKNNARTFDLGEETMLEFKCCQALRDETVGKFNYLVLAGTRSLVLYQPMLNKVLFKKGVQPK